MYLCIAAIVVIIIIIIYFQFKIQSIIFSFLCGIWNSDDNSLLILSDNNKCYILDTNINEQSTFRVPIGKYIDIKNYYKGPFELDFEKGTLKLGNRIWTKSSLSSFYI